MKTNIFNKIFFIFSVIAIAVIKLKYHELWKDEWQAYLVARDMNLFDMLNFLNYEGHPSLWYLYLKFWSIFSTFIKEDILISLSHLLLVGIALYLIYFRLSLHQLLKIGFVFSYFIFYEYAIVNRGYILVVLFTILTVLSIKENKKLLTAIFLVLLCQTEISGVIIALSLSFFLFLKHGNVKTLYKEKFLFGIITGLLLFTMTVFPRGNQDDFSRAYNQSGITVDNFIKAFQGYLGNTFGIGVFKDTAAFGTSDSGIAIGILALIISFYLFYNEKKLMFTWFIGMVGFIGFATLVFNGGVRQWGMLFIFFIALIELQNVNTWNNKFIFSFTLLLCAAPIMHNLRSCFYEINLNYSNAKEAGNFIKNKIPQNVAIVSLNKFESAAAGAYAERRFFHLPSGEPFTYFKWLEKIYVPTQQELILFAKYKKARGLIVVNNKPIDLNRFPMLKIWEKFDGENIKKENYYFYILDLNTR